MQHGICSYNPTIVNDISDIIQNYGDKGENILIRIPQNEEEGYQLPTESITSTKLTEVEYQVFKRYHNARKINLP